MLRNPICRLYFKKDYLFKTPATPTGMNIRNLAMGAIAAAPMFAGIACGDGAQPAAPTAVPRSSSTQSATPDCSTATNYSGLRNNPDEELSSRFRGEYLVLKGAVIHYANGFRPGDPPEKAPVEYFAVVAGPIDRMCVDASGNQYFLVNSLSPNDPNLATVATGIKNYGAFTEDGFTPANVEYTAAVSTRRLPSAVRAHSLEILLKTDGFPLFNSFVYDQLSNFGPNAAAKVYPLSVTPVGGGPAETATYEVDRSGRLANHFPFTLGNGIFTPGKNEVVVFEARPYKVSDPKLQ